MGCFGPIKREYRIAGMRLNRCPNWYLSQSSEEDIMWVNRIISLYNWWKNGTLESAEPNLTLADRFGIDIVDQELKRIEYEQAKKARKKMESTK
jgi:hypothetical protein